MFFGTFQYQVILNYTMDLYAEQLLARTNATTSREMRH